MTRHLSRRTLIKAGLGVAAGGAVGGTVRLADRCGLIPANHRGIYGLSETLTYAGQRLLTKLPSMAREFDRSQISTVSPVNGKAPTTEPYQRLLAGRFADWRLTIDGMVERPGIILAGRVEKLPFPQPNHPSGVRRRLVVYRRMDRRAVVFRAGSCRNP